MFSFFRKKDKERENMEKAIEVMPTRDVLGETGRFQAEELSLKFIHLSDKRSGPDNLIGN